jgi:hypothetical protein
MNNSNNERSPLLLRRPTTALLTDNTSCLARLCRVVRYVLAVAGAVVSLAFLAFGIYMRSVAVSPSSGSASLENDLVIAFGIFMCLVSGALAVTASVNDTHVRTLVEAMHRANVDLGARVERLDVLNTEYAQTTRDLQALLATQQARMTELNASVVSIGAERDRLAETSTRFERLSAEYADALETMRKRNAEMLVTLERSDAELESLRTLAAEQRARIDSLTKLQRKSVHMIRMLSLYGDECKTLGAALKDTVTGLQQTDARLGLTAEEMALQLKALHTVTEQLRVVAASRGMPEDDENSDDDDDPLLASMV